MQVSQRRLRPKPRYPLCDLRFNHRNNSLLRSHCNNPCHAPSFNRTRITLPLQVPGQTSSTTIACTCKCASQIFISGPILGCTDVAASQCGGQYGHSPLLHLMQLAARHASKKCN